MQLTRFRVTNFRSVKDSGWIEASDITALIGENEAGKTNLLLPLWKFNPTSGGEISLLDNLPRSDYTEMVRLPENHKFIECEFVLDDEEREICRRYGADDDDCQTISVGRYFSGKWILGLTPNAAEVDFNQTLDDGNEMTLWKELKQRLPKFIYYSNYGNLDGRIYLPRVVEDLQRSGLDFRESSKLRTVKVLFEMVKLDIDQIHELGETTDSRPANQRHLPKPEEQIEQEAQSVNERAVLLSSAGTRLSERLPTVVGSISERSVTQGTFR